MECLHDMEVKDNVIVIIFQKCSRFYLDIIIIVLYFCVNLIENHFELTYSFLAHCKKLFTLLLASRTHCSCLGGKLLETDLIIEFVCNACLHSLIASSCGSMFSYDAICLQLYMLPLQIRLQNLFCVFFLFYHVFKEHDKN